MKMGVVVKCFGIFKLLFIFSIQQFCKGSLLKRQMSNFHHPAYSMFAHSPMSFPGLASGHTSGNGESECIMGDIVCPSWCLMKDEWGCKYCPCGPANGLSPPVIKEEEHVQHESRHECLGTMLCMLTCKDGYQLGPRRENGCQSCYCKKITNAKVSTTPIPITTKVTGTTGATNVNSSMFHMTGQLLNKGPSSSSKECKWPLCMNGKPPNGGPHIGSTSSNSAGGFVSPGDCFGPSCSAKNDIFDWCFSPYGRIVFMKDTVVPDSYTGMRLVNQLGSSNGKHSIPPGTKPTTATQLVPTLGTERRCPLTDDCIGSCTSSVQLAPSTKPGGCPACRCVTNEMTPPLPVPTPTSCPLVEKCKAECRMGFQIIPSKTTRDCPRCSCIQQLVPDLQKPNYLTICPETVRCMETCNNGYTLTPSSQDRCPTCICKAAPPVHHTISTAAETCPDTVQCIADCNSSQYTLTGVPGQRCPKCECHSQANHCGELGCIPNATKKPPSVVLSPGQCMAILHCVMTCQNGYDIGDIDKDGCPTCRCIE